MFNYVLIITEEADDNLTFYADNPEKGLLRNILFGNSADNLMKGEYEGLFYQLYEMNEGKRIGYGVLNLSSLKDDINYFVNGSV